MIKILHHTIDNRLWSVCKIAVKSLVTQITSRGERLGRLVIVVRFINSLAPGWCGSNLKSMIFKVVILNSTGSLGACEIAHRWMPQNLTNEKSTLVQVMSWCHQAITWANIDPDLCCHMASLGYKELICHSITHLPTCTHSDVLSLSGQN